MAKSIRSKKFENVGEYVDFLNQWVKDNPEVKGLKIVPFDGWDKDEQADHGKIDLPRIGLFEYFGEDAEFQDWDETTHQGRENEKVVLAPSYE